MNCANCLMTDPTSVRICTVVLWCCHYSVVKITSVIYHYFFFCYSIRRWNRDAVDVAWCRQLRSDSRGLLNFPRYNMSNYGRRAFCFAGPYVWNSLPEYIRQSTSISVLKRRAVARILFQPRQRGEPGIWGQSPQRGLGAEPLVRGLGGEAPLKLKAFH